MLAIFAYASPWGTGKETDMEEGDSAELPLCSCRVGQHPFA